jgi:hypothetical protein
MTVAIPGSQLEELLQSLQQAGQADRAVAGYAAEDAKRFG